MANGVKVAVKSGQTLDDLLDDSIRQAEILNARSAKLEGVVAAMQEKLEKAQERLKSARYRLDRAARHAGIKF
jgi:outer membrane murein-binding lipoprotein Lpp